MSETRKDQIQNLLAQDPSLTTFSFEEFRMKLEQSIRDLESRARKIRRASFWGLGIYLTTVVAILPLSSFQLFENSWARLAWGWIGGISLFVTAILTTIYQYKYQPALQNAKSELQTTTIMQLQRQMAELTRKIDGM